MVDILWIVPARSGSKGIKNKNIRLLNGIPLLAYRISSALKISPNNTIWISTNSKSYAKLAEQYGAEVPFLRPSRLATGTARTSDVVLHAMKFATSRGYKFKYVGVLEPTSPFISVKTLKKALNYLRTNPTADAIVATRKVSPGTFYIQRNKKYLSDLATRIQTHGVLRRQDEKEEITPSGGFYISKWDSFLQLKSFYVKKTLSYVVPENESLEIDEPLDWIWAEFLIQRKICSLPKPKIVLTGKK